VGNVLHSRAAGAEHGWQRAQLQRSLILFLLLGALAGLMALHLYQLQFNPTIVAANLAELQRRWHSYNTPHGRRGNILFRDGTLLAGTRKVARAIAEPARVDDADFHAALPALPAQTRYWLHEAIATAHPGHPWLLDLNTPVFGN
jgi:hypothetical protein